MLKQRYSNNIGPLALIFIAVISINYVWKRLDSAELGILNRAFVQLDTHRENTLNNKSRPISTELGVLNSTFVQLDAHRQNTLPKINRSDLKQENRHRFIRINYQTNCSDLKQTGICQLMTKNKYGKMSLVSIADSRSRFLVHNWILSLKRTGLNKFVVFCIDTQLLSYLYDLGYEKNTMLVPHEWLAHPNQESLSGEQITVEQSKASVWYHLIALNQTFVYSDPDVVWLNNGTLEHLENQFNHSYADIMFAQDPSPRALSYNTGFFYAQATLFTRKLFAEVVDEFKRTEKLTVHGKEQNDEMTSNFSYIDQNARKNIFLATKFNDSRADSLDPLLYANGMVHFSLKLNQKMNIDPLIVHVNHLSSNEQKVEALRSVNLWFVPANNRAKRNLNYKQPKKEAVNSIQILHRFNAKFQNRPRFKILRRSNTKIQNPSQFKAKNQLLTHHKPEVKDEIVDMRVDKLMRDNQIGNVTVITIANFGFKEFLLNWILHMEKHKYTKFVVFSFDQALVDYLVEKGYRNSVILVPNKWLVYNLTTNFSNYGQEAYIQMVKSKTSVWDRLLVRNHSFLYSDPDVVWLSEHIIDHIKFQYEHSFAEILFSQDLMKRTPFCNTGFFLATPTPFVKALFTTMLNHQRIRNEPQQPILGRILSATRFNDSRIDTLDILLYANGHVHFEKNLNQKMAIRPLTVHANYVVGRDAKIKKLKSLGYWLL